MMLSHKHNTWMANKAFPSHLKSMLHKRCVYEQSNTIFAYDRCNMCEFVIDYAYKDNFA